MTLKRRLVSAFGASVLGPVVTVFVQLINVPVMLHYWGAHLYGEWLILSTIPAYLILTDLGFGNVAGSDMTMRVHRGDREGALETFQSIAVMVLLVSVILGVLLSAVIFVLPIHRLLHLSSMSSTETKDTLFFLCLNCLVLLQWSVIGAAYRCAGRYALVMFFVNVFRVMEAASFLTLLVWHAGPVQLSMLMLGISIVGTTWLLFMKMKMIPWLPLGLRHANLKRVHELWRPALAYMSFPTGSAISLQGMTMMVGIVMGPLAVALFNPMRTLSRPVFQLTDAVKFSVWQELSAAFGQRNWHLARKLHRAACQISVLLALLATLLLAVLGKRIFALWTHGRLVMDVPAFYILLAVVFLNSFWNASSSVPLAANKHHGLAVVYLFFTSLSLLLAYPLIRILGLSGAGIALTTCEIAMSIYVVQMSNKLLSDRWPAFAASMLELTPFCALREKLFRRSV